jgi:hypothetical protein
MPVRCLTSRLRTLGHCSPASDAPIFVELRDEVAAGSRYSPARSSEPWERGSWAAVIRKLAQMFPVGAANGRSWVGKRECRATSDIRRSNAASAQTHEPLFRSDPPLEIVVLTPINSQIADYRSAYTREHIPHAAPEELQKIVGKLM